MAPPEAGGLRQPDSQVIDRRHLEQAAQWYAILLAEDASSADHDGWRAWMEQPGHRQAWLRMEAIGRKFQPLNTCRQQPDAVLAAIRAGKRPDAARRKMLLGLAWMPVVGGLSYAAWRGTPLSHLARARFSDYATATGEVREFLLEDGTQVWLNTASILDQDYRYDLRRLHLLEGEILVQTAPDPRPFVVDTAHGRLRALGTRFIVRLEDDLTSLAVYEGAVEIRTAGGSAVRVLQAGEQTRFDRYSIAVPEAADTARQQWRQGIFQADSISVRQLAAELERYHHVYLSVAPDVAELRVMGTFPLHDLDAALAMLRASLPVRWKRTLPWWISIQAV